MLTAIWSKFPSYSLCVRVYGNHCFDWNARLLYRPTEFLSIKRCRKLDLHCPVCKYRPTLCYDEVDSRHPSFSKSPSCFIILCLSLLLQNHVDTPQLLFHDSVVKKTISDSLQLSSFFGLALLGYEFLRSVELHMHWQREYIHVSWYASDRIWRIKLL